MCELCKGTHVIHIYTSYSIKFAPCPICRPHQDADARFLALYQKFFIEDDLKGA
ncbi:hypothetical protein HNR53_003154 [Bacillus benzoevorans]|uniref:Uncharacterized protein n=1 Tax=Bacillus benzoevorans TaxID=1456 RepID=A0A7X0HVP7_9BACI|nr:hypothetical protein [Bacillus benzoevorans]